MPPQPPTTFASRTALSLLRPFALLLLLASCLAPQNARAAEPLRIAAAADLQPVLPAILAQFTAQTGIAAEASYQASALLAEQIRNGAPFDLFLAADTSFPQRVIDAGLAEQQRPVVYARGTLVLWALKDAPLLAGSHLTMDTLHNPALRRLAIANPDHAPYGRAAKAALTSLGLLPGLASTLVTAENISQTAQFVSTGNADLGLLSLTSALSPQLRDKGVYVEVPRTAYPPILQGAVILKRSTMLPSAHRLLDFLASPAIRASMATHGLAAPE